MTPASSIFGFVLNALVVGLVTTFFNAIFFYRVTRREHLRDAEIRDLHSDLKTLKNERLTKLEERMNDTLDKLETDKEEQSQKRSLLYARLDADFIHRRECSATQENMNRIFAEQSRRLDGMGAELTEVNKTTSGMDSILKLIADRLAIKLEGRHQG